MPPVKRPLSRRPARDREADAALLRAAYLLLLRREPDEGGLARNLEQLATGQSWEQVLAELVRSPEFDQLHRPGGDESVVRAAWRAVLWRDPPPAALRWYTQQIAEGLSIGDLIDALSEIDNVPTIAAELDRHRSAARDTARELEALRNRLAALETRLLDTSR